MRATSRSISRDQRPAPFAIAEFVDVFHAAPPHRPSRDHRQERVHEIPEDVIGGDVAFLDAVDRARRHDEAMVDHAGRRHLPAIAAGTGRS